MSGAVHTPGPWLRSNHTVYALDETRTCNRFSTLVQGGFTVNSRSSGKRVAEEELDANARLIAAAPELVEALRDAIEWDGRDEHGVDAVWLPRAEALLARIEGKSA